VTIASAVVHAHPLAPLVAFLKAMQSTLSTLTNVLAAVAVQKLAP
jgi:hypothetical protein